MALRFLVIIIAAWSISLSAETDPPQSADAGEIIRYETGNGGMLATAGVEWDRYTKIRLEKATVEFREGWVRDQRLKNNNVVREADVERIKSEMSGLLEQVLVQTIDHEEAYTLSDENGPDVLRFTPRIEKLDIYAPGRVQDFVGHVLIDSMGSMVVVMEISDSVSGKLLASSWQLQVDPEDGFLDSATSAANKTAFHQMMGRWTTWFFELLDYVKAGQ